MKIATSVTASWASVILRWKFVANPHKSGAGEVVAAKTTIDGTVSDDPTGLKHALEAPISTVDQTGKALTEAADALKVTARKVDDLIDTERKDLHDVLANAADSLQGVREILGDKQTQARLADAMKKLPDTLDTMNRAFKSADEGFQKFTAPSGPDGKSGVDRHACHDRHDRADLAKVQQGGGGKRGPRRPDRQGHVRHQRNHRADEIGDRPPRQRPRLDRRR